MYRALDYFHTVYEHMRNVGLTKSAKKFSAILYRNVALCVIVCDFFLICCSPYSRDILFCMMCVCILV